MKVRFQKWACLAADAADGVEHAAYFRFGGNQQYI